MSYTEQEYRQQQDRSDSVFRSLFWAMCFHSPNRCRLLFAVCGQFGIEVADMLGEYSDVVEAHERLGMTDYELAILRAGWHVFSRLDTAEKLAALVGFGIAEDEATKLVSAWCISAAAGLI